MRHEFTLNQAAKIAVKSFRDAKPWRGPFAQRLEKFTALHQSLSEACDVVIGFEFRGQEVDGLPGNGGWAADINSIILVGKLSVVTYLACFVMACGCDRDTALMTARDIFRHYFPRSFGGCRQVGDLLLRDQTLRN